MRKMLWHNHSLDVAPTQLMTGRRQAGDRQETGSFCNRSQLHRNTAYVASLTSQPLVVGGQTHYCHHRHNYSPQTEMFRNGDVLCFSAWLCRRPEIAVASIQSHSYRVCMNNVCRAPDCNDEICYTPAKGLNRHVWCVCWDDKFQICWVYICWV